MVSERPGFRLLPWGRVMFTDPATPHTHNEPPMKQQHSIALFASLLGLATAAHGQVAKVGTTLFITTGHDDDIFKVVVPSSGIVDLFGVKGVASGKRFNGIESIEIRTRGGLDKIQFQSFVAITPKTLINTGPGPSEVDIDVKVPGAGVATTDFRVYGHNDQDKCFIEIQNKANVCQNNWDIALGMGENHALTQVTSDVPSSKMGVALKYAGGASKDHVLVDSVTKAKSLDFSLIGQSGEGDDEIATKFLQSVPSTVSLLYNYYTVGGNDKALVGVVGGANSVKTNVSGVINTGAGDDEIATDFTSSFHGNMKILASAGDDKAVLLVKGAHSGSTLVHMGDGHDFIGSFIAGTMLTEPVANGGPGFDTFQGHAQILNCEKIDN
jgi:hypothetical protein